MNMKEKRSWGIAVLNWAYKLEKGKLVRTYYKDILSWYPPIIMNNYPKYKKGGN
jgi:hypothetical protein